MSDEPENTVAAAANAEEREALGFKAWPESGAQVYRVVHQTGFVDVEAKTGNEAAEKALAQIGGGKVTNIAPSPQQRKPKAA